MTNNISNKKEKKDLERASEEHKHAFEEELSEALDKGKRIATSALVIGGGFALSYYLIRKMTGGSTKKIKKIKGKGSQQDVKEVVINRKPSVFSTVGNVVLTEIAVFLLAIAKEKLIEYLENQREDANSKDAK